jgi:aminoglycoside/choline kinase family phosphotransferase
MSAPSNASAIVWSDPRRGSTFSNWLASIAAPHGLDVASVQLASADASFRRYFRVGASGAPSSCGSFIIMDAPPEKEDCKPFVKVAALMLDAGLPAPRVLAWDEAAGFMLLNDLGHKTMMDVIAPPAAVDAIAQPSAAHHALYMEAVDLLIRWQLSSKPGVLPPYDDTLLSREMALFPEWYVSKHKGITLSSDAQRKLGDAFAQIKASNLQSLDGVRVFVHRDFMPRNIITADSRSQQFSDGPPLGKLAPSGGSALHEVKSVGALSILDFQDAVYGPITYDIASLMRDAFLTWEEDFVLEITVRYWQQARKAGLPVGDDFGEFYRAVEWMGLQRHLKVLGIFARLTLRDGKPRYLLDTPRFIQYARNTAARYRQLGPLMVLLDEIEGNITRVGYTF